MSSGDPPPSTFKITGLDGSEDYNFIIENVSTDNFVVEKSILEELCPIASSSSSEWNVEQTKDSDAEEWSIDSGETERLTFLRHRQTQYEFERNRDYENELFGASFFSEISDERDKTQEALHLDSHSLIDMGRGESPYARRDRSRSVEKSRKRSYSRSPRRSRRSRSRSPRGARIPRGRYYDGRENPDPSPCLGVFGMSLHTNERDLKKIFGQYGEIETVQIVYDRFSGRSRGFGFVYFKNTRDSAKAKDHLKDAVIDGMKVRVDYSVTRGGGPYTFSRHYQNSRSRSRSESRRSSRRGRSPVRETSHRQSRSPVRSRSASRNRSEAFRSRSPSR